MQSIPLRNHIFNKNVTSDSPANDIVATLLAIIENAQWLGEEQANVLNINSITNTYRIHVEVCQAIDSHLRAGQDPIPAFAQFYNFSPRLPGSSLGPKDFLNSASTLYGYVKHILSNGKEQIYGLTCNHVLNLCLSTQGYITTMGNRNA
jgi:hypothetical protein